MQGLSLDAYLRQIAAAKRFEELRSLRGKLHRAGLAELNRTDPLQWNFRMNRIHDQLIIRTIILSEDMLRERGMGAPPVPYAFVLLGSGGRNEQSLWSDQDNGLIYEDGEESGLAAQDVEAYFHVLVGCIVHGLEILGYPPCHGNVLCSNARWRKPLREWKRMIAHWFDTADWEAIRYLLIQADLRFLYGESRLADTLKEYFMKQLAERPQILKGMLNNTLHHKVALGFFGQMIRERYGEHAGGVDVKYGAYIPFVNAIRLLSLSCGAEATSTSERIRELALQGMLDPESADRCRKVLSMLLRFRAMTPLRQTGGMYSTEGKLPRSMLKAQYRRDWVQCLKTGRWLQNLVKRQIQVKRL
jgi:CBS domain-containing protein